MQLLSIMADINKLMVDVGSCEPVYHANFDDERSNIRVIKAEMIVI